MMLLGRILARKARNATQRLLMRPQFAETFGPSVRLIFVQVAYYGVIVIAIIFALALIGVPATAILTITGAIIVVLAIAVRESLSNFAATIIVLTFQPYKQGELIETMGRIGVVQEIQLFNTLLLQGDQRLVWLPNSKIQENGVMNYTRMGIIRADVAATVGYDEDLNHVRTVLMNLITGDPRVLKDPPPEIVVLELGEKGVRVEAHAMVRLEDYWTLLSDFRERIKTRFDAEGIHFSPVATYISLTSTIPQ
jgi:small conductance mechanosensitive channel